ncbi:hypothetical protein [Paenibacillus macquariensis]|uniref:hypothetical protein n=1 Tax=Paenibacillus macquariensis TaxID=948756 RepID=UPI0007C24385|nr:hypothetical protein [Paenibacillus macquariensis]OAB27370.1 hypothetical protein PMSM_25495 [Paenibacillus macquariensis subsp. macquariensis]
MKNLTIFDHYSERENNATKALIDLLRHSETRLTKLFISSLLKISELNPNMDDRQYDLQIGQRLIKPRGHGYVVSIRDARQESVETRVYTDLGKDDSIPDALIQFNNVSLLIESKLDGGKVDLRQIKNHEARFAEGEIIHAPKFFIWQEVHSFLKEIQDSSIYNWNDVTAFLLGQYLSYCEHMGFTYQKEESYILAYFINRPNVQRVIEEVDNYLKSLPEVYFEEHIRDCFGYKLRLTSEKKTPKFFSSSKYKKGTYIAHLLDSQSTLEWQGLVDSRFTGNQKYNRTALKEVHINMDLVENMSEIKDLIDFAYHERRKKLALK